jgi:photosystem II cytochrome c550
MFQPVFPVRFLGFFMIVFLSLGLASFPAQAGSLEPYVMRYLDAKEPVPLVVDSQGNTQLFSAIDLSEGQRLFEENCLNCHVGGSTLPNPMVSLSLEALKGAVPPRDTIRSLVAFIRQPMSYDGSEDEYLCRQIPDSWLPTEEVEKLAAFVLRSAQKAPGWGSTSF